MILLYKNDLQSYTAITSDNPNASYPVSNLLNEFLQKKYQSSSIEDTIYITLDDIYDVDCVAFAYHNLSELVLRVYNAADTLVHTETITTPRANEMKYFTSVEAKRIEIDVASSGNCYLGTVYLGEQLQMPYVSTTPNFGRRINSFVRQTSGGQSTGQKRSVLKTIDMNFVDVTTAQFDQITTLIETVQNVDKIFIDTWSGSSYMQPMYGRIDIDNITAPQQPINGVLYDLQIPFVECN